MLFYGNWWLPLGMRFRQTCASAKRSTIYQIEISKLNKKHSKKQSTFESSQQLRGIFPTHKIWISPNNACNNAKQLDLKVIIFPKIFPKKKECLGKCIFLSRVTDWNRQRCHRFLNHIRSASGWKHFETKLFKLFYKNRYLHLWSTTHTCRHIIQNKISERQNELNHMGYVTFANLVNSKQLANKCALICSQNYDGTFPMKSILGWYRIDYTIICVSVCVKERESRGIFTFSAFIWSLFDCGIIYL